MKALVLAQHDNVSLNDASAKTVAAAHAMGAEIHLLVACCDAPNLPQLAAVVPNVNSVLLADHPSFKNALAEPLANLIVQLAPQYDVLVAPASSDGKNVMPRVAAELDIAQISEIIAVRSPDTFDRPVYAGNAVETVQTSQPKNVITVRTASFQAPPEPQKPAPVTPVTPNSTDSPSSHVQDLVTKSERPDLASARVVISGGRGMKAGENFKLLENVADLLGAAVGASRAAVDSGFVPNDLQVGQTGKVVAPELYIAVGISGAIQHLAGMKDSRVIVAINSDEDAPIFQVADYGLVADLFQALPELESALKSKLRPHYDRS